MKTKTILNLLNKWEKLLEHGEAAFTKNVSKLKNGLEHRVRIINNKFPIYDVEFTLEHKNIINELCQLVPEYKDTLLSKPDISGDWPAKDYIEIYFSHYNIMVRKIKKAIS